MKLIPPLDRGRPFWAGHGLRCRPDPACTAGCLRAKALPLATQRPRDGGLVSPSRLYYGIWTLWDLDAGGRGGKERHVRPVGACRWVLELNVPPSCVADLRFPASRLRVRYRGRSRRRPERCPV